MKNFRLFKRDDAGREMSPSATGYKERPYYFRFNYRKTTYLRCLETNLKDEAQTRARARFAEITKAVQTSVYGGPLASGRLDGAKLRQSGSATLEEIYQAYKVGPSEAAATARRVNTNALKAIAGSAVSLRDLTPALARQFFQTVSTKAATVADQSAAASLKRSANSRWTQAASLFTDKCLQHYRDQGLLDDNTLVAITDFLKAGKAARFDKKKLKVVYRPPSDTIITKTLDAWLQLEDRDLFLVIGHCLAFGLRKGEMIQATWTWHTTRNGYPAIDSEATVKNGTGLVQVRALDPFYTAMMNRVTEKQWRAQGDAGLIVASGTDTYRHEDIYNSVSSWLRALGWETQKTNHALRAYAGSQIAMRYGIWDASTWLRHSSVEVTQGHYTYFIKTFPIADKTTIAAHWAVAPDEAKVTSAKPDATLDASENLRYVPLDSAKISTMLGETRN